MKFNCGKKQSRLEKAKAWHKHFAWLPVQVSDNDCRWLETIERSFPDAWVGPITGKVRKEQAEYRALVK